jgi:hypothetical protein
MSKYEELKRRIEKVEGWTKEADDLIQIIHKHSERCSEKYYSLTISLNQHDGNVVIRRFSDSTDFEDKLVTFHFKSQCSKNRAFKDALLWLLDHSDIKKDLVGQEVKAEIEGKVYKVKVLKAI